MQISDNELEYLEETDPRSQLANARMPQRTHNPVPLYDLSLAQAPTLEAKPGLLVRKVGPLPVWGWGLLVAGVGGAGYAWYRIAKASKVKPNDGEEREESRGSDEHEEERTPGGWSPSRTQFGKQVERYLTRKGLGSKCKVYTDADEADKDKELKTVSPLITIKVTGAKIKVEKDLDRLCKREGLSPTMHEDGSIGLYPTTSKRGKEWEEYVDALRDDGQKR